MREEEFVFRFLSQIFVFEGPGGGEYLANTDIFTSNDKETRKLGKIHPCWERYNSLHLYNKGGG